jgi:hypothetical protein
MNIAVISPHTRKNGNTTIASLLALELSTRGKNVCLTHTAIKSPAMYEYFSLREADGDKTANPSKLVTMLKAGAVKPEEISEYCKNITTGVDAFTVNDRKFTDEDLSYALDYIADKFPYDLKVFDIDDDYGNETTKRIVAKCDFIILVITQSIMELYDFKTELKYFEKLLKYKPSMIVVNKFDRRICDIKAVQTVLGATVSKKSSWLTVRYNPQVVRFENYGKTLDLYNAMRKDDISVVDIANDFKQIANRVMKCRQQERMTKAKKEIEAMEREAKALEAATGNPAASLEKSTPEDSKDKK